MTLSGKIRSGMNAGGNTTLAGLSMSTDPARIFTLSNWMGCHRRASSGFRTWELAAQQQSRHLDLDHPRGIGQPLSYCIQKLYVNPVSSCLSHTLAISAIDQVTNASRRNQLNGTSRDIHRVKDGFSILGVVSDEFGNIIEMH